MTGEANVQLNPGTGGLRVRTLEVTAVQPDGTLATVEMQVATIATPSGKVLDFDRIEDLLEDILEQLQEMNETLEDKL
jgi:hypothetical protein